MFELFHAISDAQSARVRKYVVDQGLVEQVRFRNVTYDEVKKDLAARGGTAAPALWDGVTLLSGADAILARLATLRPQST
jgi:hypothetical protein